MRLHFDSVSLGHLSNDPDVEDWLVSRPIAVPYFDGVKLPFYWDGDIEDSVFLAQAESASEQFLRLTESERQKNSSLLQRYIQVLNSVSVNSQDIWDLVTPYEVFVRSPAASTIVSVNCRGAWDQDHSFKLVFPDGKFLQLIASSDNYFSVDRNS